MNVYSPYAQSLPARQLRDYPKLPTYGDTKAAADHYNRYGEEMPEEWLPTNLAIRQKALKTGRRPAYKYYYQKGSYSKEDLQAIKEDLEAFDKDTKSRRRTSAAAACYAASNMNSSPMARPPIQANYMPPSFPQPPPVEQMPRPPPPPQQYAYATQMPLPSSVRPQPMMQPMQQRPQQRPPYISRQSTSSMSESDYSSDSSYYSRPPKSSHQKHQQRKKERPLSVAGRLNKAYEEKVLENVGGLADTIEEVLFGGSSKKKSTSGHRHHSSRRDSFSDADSYSTSDEDEAYERRHRRRSAAPRDLRRSSLSNTQRMRYGGDSYRHSVCV